MIMNNKYFNLGKVNWKRGRAVKAIDLKSIGVSPREFESHRFRIFLFLIKSNRFKTCYININFKF